MPHRTTVKPVDEGRHHANVYYLVMATLFPLFVYSLIAPAEPIPWPSPIVLDAINNKAPITDEIVFIVRRMSTVWNEIQNVFSDCSPHFIYSLNLWMKLLNRNSTTVTSCTEIVQILLITNHNDEYRKKTV